VKTLVNYNLYIFDVAVNELSIDFKKKVREVPLS